MVISDSNKLIRLACTFLFFIGAAVQAQPKNVIFILSDDHRYDYMGFHPESPDFLNTPSMDRMAAEGAHIANAFVSTSLCSPSRASILTGQYAFRHGAVDNQNEMKPSFLNNFKTQGTRPVISASGISVMLMTIRNPDLTGGSVSGVRVSIMIPF